MSDSTEPDFPPIPPRIPVRKKGKKKKAKPTHREQVHVVLDVIADDALVVESEAKGLQSLARTQHGIWVGPTGRNQQHHRWVRAAAASICGHQTAAMTTQILALTEIAVTDPLAGLRIPDVISIDQLDGQASKLGVANGVVDLTEKDPAKRLLTGADAAACWVSAPAVTRYVPGANDSAEFKEQLAKLMSNMSADAKEWLLNWMAISLHGRPAKRGVLLLGPKDSGKTTTLNMYSWTLGPTLAVKGNPRALDKHAKARDMFEEGSVWFKPARAAIYGELDDITLDGLRWKELLDGDVSSRRQMYSPPDNEQVTAIMFGCGNPERIKNLGTSDPATAQRWCSIYLTEIEPEDIDPSLILLVRDPGPRGQAFREGFLAELVERAVGFEAGHQLADIPEVVANRVRMIEEGRTALEGWLQHVIDVKANPPDKSVSLTAGQVVRLWNAMYPKSAVTVQKMSVALAQTVHGWTSLETAHREDGEHRLSVTWTTDGQAMWDRHCPDRGEGWYGRAAEPKRWDERY